MIICSSASFFEILTWILIFRIAFSPRLNWDSAQEVCVSRKESYLVLCYRRVEASFGNSGCLEVQRYPRFSPVC